MVDVSVSNKPRFTVCQWTDCKVIKVALIKEKHEWLTHHIVSVSLCALAAGLALIYSRGGDLKTAKSPGLTPGKGGRGDQEDPGLRAWVQSLHSNAETLQSSQRW